MTKDKQDIKYCLYARKSSESNERQAMSIDSQIKEMTELAEKNELEIVETKKESYSAKNFGTRPLFLEMLHELDINKYNAILTWAPDRLSRNAGDLGSLVDMMDKGKLLHIKTNSQSFSNKPDEKFLLMILCSQAKLENDNRGLNVRRGIRAKCEMGWRPAPAPLGYLNYSHAGVKKIMIDEQTAPVIKKMFETVAHKDYTGRKLKDWLDNDEKLRTQKKNKLPLSMVYRILKNTFYYGEFEYPKDSGNWYDGAHEPIISKELFDKVQIKLDKNKTNNGKTKWGSRNFDFKGYFKCAYCGASVIGEIKHRRLKNGGHNKHIYYHCTKSVNYDCPEPYIKKEDLVDEILRYVRFVEKKNNKSFQFDKALKRKIKKYKATRENILNTQSVKTCKEFTFSEYARHILKSGNKKEIKVVMKALGMPLYIHNKNIYSSAL